MRRLADELRRFPILAATLLPFGLPCVAAQQPASQDLPLHPTFAEAKQYALLHNPRIRSAGSLAQAEDSVARQARAARLPSVSGNVTAAEADHNTTLAVGAVHTSSLYSRFAAGLSVSQLITDFGRTSALISSAGLRAQARAGAVETVRAGVLLEVAQGWFQTLGADAVLGAAKAAVQSREITLRQIRALAESSLRFTLDVRFAEVALSQAELDLYRAENNTAEARANLSAALGLEHTEDFVLPEEPMPAALPDDPAASLQAAMRQRPEVKVLSLVRDAARRYAEAEGDLKRPGITVAGVTGTLPAGDPRLSGTYSAAAVNVSIPVFNGGLFAARRAEAEQRLAAAESDIRELAVRISREVRSAWLEARTAERRMLVTARLEAEANEALRLAQTRYDAGLGSIVELSQAQLSQTSARIENAGARYEYLNRRAVLYYATGGLQ